MHGEVVKLDAHGWTLELLPALGGAIGALRHEDHDVLRPSPACAEGVLETACFPLVPYANRIAHGRFEFAGARHQLPLNFGDHPHSLHGLGWHAAWTVGEAGAAHATLIHTHRGGPAWPWPYRATQRFELAPGQATIELALTSDADMPVPVGLGLHPYFPVDASTRLTFDASQTWLTDAMELPFRTAPAEHFADWAAGAPVSGPALIDNAYEGWDGSLRIDQSWGRIELEAEEAPILHLYRPPGEGFFCVEPVSHLPDAINCGGIDLLQPGATRSLRMTFRV